MADIDQEHQKELRANVGQFPKLPGVYLMRDEHGEVIYIGKARELRTRVRNYFGAGDGRYQIQYLMGRVWGIDHVVTNTEEEAFLLERDLINRYKPRYNIRLKDDKAYLSVRIDKNDPWPRIETSRRVEQDGALYFGPYVSGYELKSVLDVIRNSIPLRSCTNTVFYNRQRPCLEYQIKRCAGPCCLPVDRDEYVEWVDEAIQILKGKTVNLISQLEARMNEASTELQFESAAAIRDQISVLEEYASGGRQMAVHHGESRDAFSMYRESTRAVICVLKVRAGRISDTEAFPLEDIRVSDEELLESALSQYYEGGREIPQEIIIPLELENADLLSKAFAKRVGASVDLSVPKIGSKARLLKLAELNAKQSYASRFDSDSIYDKVSKDLSKLCALKQIPRRVECVDISNFQGSDIVGALVVFYDGVPQKQDYKKYKIRSQRKPDDFASVHEVVKRRLERGIEEGDLPDLLVIDGGKGQLDAALRARDELEVKLEIISLAKMRVESPSNSQEITHKPERLFIEDEKESIPLDPANDVTLFMQRIRDEVHRFVISFHRKTRAKSSTKSVLDEIAGLGPERKRRLLNAFGSVEQIKKQDAESIAKAGRMPLPLAEKVLDHI